MFSILVALAAVAVDGDVPDYVDCVPSARQISGISIYGNALTWWKQAEGHYARGNAPRKGAVLAFKPYGAMTLGHVAAVSKVIDDRNILVTHANWSLIDGHRGRIERDVRVVDVSEEGNWSKVRVWYAPLEGLGTTLWPVHGFIYPSAAPVDAPKLRYASVVNFEAKAPEPQPTGKLSYLGKVLTRLK